MSLPYTNNHSTNFAVAQGGSKIVLGSHAGEVTVHDYTDLRYALMGRSTEYFTHFDDFVGNIGVQPTPWKKTGGSTGTALIDGAAAVAGGQVKLLTAATSADYLTLALGASWTATNGFLFYETYVKLNQLTATTLEIGLSDAISETAGLAFSDHTVASVTEVATDAAIFAYDSVAGANWLINTVKNGTQQAYNTGVAASTSFIKLGMTVSTTGSIEFYVNDVLITTIANAITASALVGPWNSIVATAAALKSANIDYIVIAGTR